MTKASEAGRGLPGDFMDAFLLSEPKDTVLCWALNHALLVKFL